MIRYPIPEKGRLYAISLSLVTDIISPQTADLCSYKGQTESENIPIPDNACCPRKNPELCRTLVEALAFPVPLHSTLHAGEELSSLSEHLNKYESRRGAFCRSTWIQKPRRIWSHSIRRLRGSGRVSPEHSPLVTVGSIPSEVHRWQ